MHKSAVECTVYADKGTILFEKNNILYIYIYMTEPIMKNVMHIFGNHILAIKILLPCIKKKNILLLFNHTCIQKIDAL